MHSLFCNTQVDNDTMDMLRTMNMSNLPGVKVQQVIIKSISISAVHSLSTCICALADQGVGRGLKDNTLGSRLI